MSYASSPKAEKPKKMIKMIKSKKGGPSNLEAVELARTSFAAGTLLPRSKRQEILRGFTRMSHRMARRVVIHYARGLIQETGEQLERVVHAWLVIGERFFNLLFRAVQRIRLIVERAPELVDDFLRWAFYAHVGRLRRIELFLNKPLFA